MKRLMEKIEEIFVNEGILSRIFPSYQPRTQQIDLAKKIFSAICHEEHLLAEAGTGTGKSFAYLFAAALWALEHDKTVVISTNTLPLQTQLMEKDLPIVEQVLSQMGYDEFRYELAKGRSHYLCKRRLELLVQTTLQTESPHRNLIEKIWINSRDLTYGMREEFPIHIPTEIWEEICGDSDDCFYHHSPFYEHCFIQNARKRWTRAHIIVANHALVFTDLALKGASENGVLPKYDRLIFDEGHRVEEVFSRFFERTISLPEMESLFRTIRLRRLGWMRTVFDEEHLKEIEEYHRQIRQELQPVFEKLAEELSENQTKNGMSTLEPVMELIETPIPFPDGFEKPISDLIEYLQVIAKLNCSEEPEKRGMAQLITRLESIAQHLKFILNCSGGQDWAHWIEKVPPLNAGILDPQAEWVRLIAQPISARTVLSDLFASVPVTFISATMSTGNSFDFIAKRLGLDKYAHFIADSPFDYRNNALLVISETAPDPRDEAAYSAFLVEGLKRVLSLTRGRTLVLFTSYSLLEKVGHQMQEWMDNEKMHLLLHLPNTERDKLIQEFKAAENRVLFGCESFWEGIDIPGDALSCVVLTKLPFANPSDPLVRAKTKMIEKNNGNSFAEFMIPNVILKTKQGVGRLIRTMEDRGAIIIMDSRIIKKSYGKQILASLPPARRGKIKQVPDYVLNKNKS